MGGQWERSESLPLGAKGKIRVNNGIERVKREGRKNQERKGKSSKEERSERKG